MKVKKGWVERYEVISPSSGALYIVARKADGTYGCSCPHWKFHKAPKPTCKHIQAMLNTTVEMNLGLVRPDLFASGFVGRRFRGEDGNLMFKEEKIGRGMVGIVVEKVEVENELFSVRRRFRDL